MDGEGAKKERRRPSRSPSFSQPLSILLFQARARDPTSSTDAYALVTCDPAAPLVAFDRGPHPHAAFHAALRSAVPYACTSLGGALRAAFDAAALWRAASGADTYGAGYTPAASAPVTIVLLTDGGALVCPPAWSPADAAGGGAPPPPAVTAGVAPALTIPPGGAGVPGAELTAQPFRWDVRLYALELGLAGLGWPEEAAAGGGGDGSTLPPPSPFLQAAAAATTLDPASSSLAAVAAATGGAAARAPSLRACLEWAERAAARPAGLVVGLEVGGPGAAVSAQAPLHPPGQPLSLTPRHPSCPLGGAAGAGGGGPGAALPLWPIPEAFRPDAEAGGGGGGGAAPLLPPRPAQPTLTAVPPPPGAGPPRAGSAAAPLIPPGFPVDTYDVDPPGPEPWPLAADLAALAAGGVAAAAATGPNAGADGGASSPPAPPLIGWPVYARGSLGDGPGGALGDPIGLLHAAAPPAGAAGPASPPGPGVALTLLPWNFPHLFRLLASLAGLPAGARLAPHPAWRDEFGRYLAGAPPAYGPPLKAALVRAGLPGHLVPDPPPPDGGHHRRGHWASSEAGGVGGVGANNPAAAAAAAAVTAAGLPPATATALRRIGAAARRELDRVVAACGAAAPWPGNGGSGETQTFRPSITLDPTVVPRSSLLPQLCALAMGVRSVATRGAAAAVRERGAGAAAAAAAAAAATLAAAAVAAPAAAPDHAPGGRFAVPVSAMGDYLASPGRAGPPPLRDPAAAGGDFGSASARARAAARAASPFGNPYASPKGGRPPGWMVDEAGLLDVGAFGGGGGTAAGRRRRVGREEVAGRRRRPHPRHPSPAAGPHPRRRHRHPRPCLPRRRPLRRPAPPRPSRPPPPARATRPPRTRRGRRC